MFVGVHERQLDDKGRLALPSAFRSLLGDACYLVDGDDRCVNVLLRRGVRATGADVMAQVRNGEVTLDPRSAPWPTRPPSSPSTSRAG